LHLGRGMRGISSTQHRWASLAMSLLMPLTPDLLPRASVQHGTLGSVAPPSRARPLLFQLLVAGTLYRGSLGGRVTGHGYDGSDFLAVTRALGHPRVETRDCGGRRHQLLPRVPANLPSSRPVLAFLDGGSPMPYRTLGRTVPRPWGCGRVRRHFANILRAAPLADASLARRHCGTVSGACVARACSAAAELGWRITSRPANPCGFLRQPQTSWPPGAAERE